MLRSNLLAYAADLSGAIDAGVQDVAEAVLTKAAEGVPVDTGALRTSIQINGAEGSGARTVEAGQGLGYAAFVEYGTARQAAQPYMTPAAAQTDAGAIVAQRLRALEGQAGL